MTVRVTSLRGSGGDLAGYYVERAGRGLTGLLGLYGDGSGGVWSGSGAAGLGLSGLVGAKDFAGVMNGLGPTGSQLGGVFSDRSVRGFDVTFSAPKDVSLLWAFGDETVQAAVLAAFGAAREAVVMMIRERAWSRKAINGLVGPVSCGLVVATFDEFTSRALDPQLHSRVIVANKTLCADGRWRALDARELMGEQQAWSALFHRGLEAELVTRLGVEFVGDGWVASRITGVPEELVTAFSQRSRTIDRNLKTLTTEFETVEGRAPTARERFRLARTARLLDRPTKTGATVTVAGAHAGWRGQAIGMGFDVDRILAETLGRSTCPVISIDRTGIVDTAIAAVSEGRSSWTVGGVVRELARALPPGTGISAAGVVKAMWRTATQVTRDQVQLRTEATTITPDALLRFTTTDIFESEKTVIEFAAATAARGGTPAPSTGTPDKDSGMLGVAQQAAADRIAGTEGFVLIEGPAGTGKTRAMRSATNRLRVAGRVVFGVAPSAQAAAELAKATGIRCDSLDKLLYEHTQPNRPAESTYDVEAGATVIVDEAAMASTPRLAQVVTLATKHDWRVVLVGDPYQFTALGRSGMFAHLTNQLPDLVTRLGAVHRFDADWEKAASLDLRAGNPDAISVYDTHHRVKVKQNDPVPQAIRNWHRARKAGQETLLMASNNTIVDHLNLAAQTHRITTGDLDPTGVAARARTGPVLEGDSIVTRRNNREYEVRNRQAWTITGINPVTGAVTAANQTGVVTLPADYVAEHVELGYAQTLTGAQGRTIDTGILIITPDTAVTADGLYVGLTRGRHSNTVIIQTARVPHQPAQTDLLTVYAAGIEQLTSILTNRWDDTPAHSQQIPVQYQTPQPARHPARAAPTVPATRPATPSPPDPVVLNSSRLRELMIERVLEETVRLDAERSIAQIDNTTLGHRRNVYATQTVLSRLAKKRDEIGAQLVEHDGLGRRRRTLKRGEVSQPQHNLNQIDTRQIPQAQTAHDQAVEAANSWEQSLDNKVMRRTYQTDLDTANTKLADIKHVLDADLAARARHLTAGVPHPNIRMVVTNPPGTDPQTWATVTATINQHAIAWPQSPTPRASTEERLAHNSSQTTVRLIQKTWKRSLNQPPPGLSR